MHGEERHVEADEHKYDLKGTQAGVKHPSSDFRPPVVNGRKYGEDHAAYEHIMEVCHHEIRVVHLQIERQHRHHDACDAAGHKDKHEAEHIQHGGLQYRPSDRKSVV